MSHKRWNELRNRVESGNPGKNDAVILSNMQVNAAGAEIALCDAVRSLVSARNAFKKAVEVMGGKDDIQEFTNHLVAAEHLINGVKNVAQNSQAEIRALIGKAANSTKS